jgi:hypothetical protein
MATLPGIGAAMGNAIGPFESGGGGDLWTPADMVTTGWYDAADASTIIQEDGFPGVERWEDKSGNANHMIQTAITIAQPDYDGSINGRPALNFHYTAKMDSTLSFGGSPAGQATCHAALYRQHANDSAPRRVLDGVGQVWFIGNYSGKHQGYNGSFRTGPNLTDIPVALLIFSKDSGDLGTVYVNGTAYGSGPSSKPITAYNISTSNFAEVDLGEVLSWDSSDEETRQLVEGSLCWKWGMQDALPGGHPYKNAAPTT